MKYTPVNNPFIDGFFKSENINVSYRKSFSNLYKSIFNDFLLNSNLYFDDSLFEDDNEKRYFIKLLKLKYRQDPDNLFFNWMKYFVEHKIKDINSFLVAILAMGENLNEFDNHKIYKSSAELIIDILTSDSQIQVENEFITGLNLKVTPELSDKLNDLKIYYADGTVNEITEFAKQQIRKYEIDSVYSESINVFSEKYSLINAQLIEEIIPILDDYFNEVIGLDWINVFPEMILNEKYFDGYNYIGFDDILFDKNHKYIISHIMEYLKDSNINNIDDIINIEKTKKLNIYNIIC